MSEKQRNIYQRILEVQKKVQTVFKNESVEITKNNKYKAVTHDDVAALLHLPLAEAGIVLVPTVTEHTVSTFEVEKKGYNNGPNYKQLQYRVDLKISVKWVNAYDPEDFIESNGGAYAIDTSDKAYAKAYSLALKIVLLKVHLLESRDGEEHRDAEKDVVYPRSNSQGQQAPPPWKTYEKFKGHFSDFIMPMGKFKGKPLKQVDFDTLLAAKKWTKEQIVKNPKPKNIAQLVDLNECLKKQIELMTPVTSQDAMAAQEFAPHPESLGMDDFGPPPTDMDDPGNYESTADVINGMKQKYGGGK